MPLNQLLVGEVNAAVGSTPTARAGRQGETIVTQLHGNYYEQARSGNLYMARAVVTAPVIFSTAAGTGGPLIWNSSSQVNVVVLAVGFGITVVSTVAAAIGLTGGTGQTVAPGSTTAIDSLTNTFLGQGTSVTSCYRVGTPAAAGSFFWPLMDVNTGALTTTPGTVRWIDIGGALVVPPNAWCSVAASATASTLVIQSCILFEEVPI